MALCSGLAPLINNHFGRRALLRGRLRLHAINATALIDNRTCNSFGGGAQLYDTSGGCPDSPAVDSWGNDLGRRF